eukprot:gb/GECG01005686.1/.p1 GENE.gb/GECG01005686.1/~~gb/GECG01005686.1/.p1  ORF type:complete len:271 (+),score=9.91 gb/GECG01005686.1/:1-813(+)
MMEAVHEFLKKDVLSLLQYVLGLSWTLAIALYTTFILFDFIPSFMRYDKSFNDSANDARERAAWTVRKSWFTHFYVLSSVMSLAISEYCCVNRYNCILTTLYALHSLRRLYECLLVHEFSSSRMTILVYLGGMAYYFVCNCTNFVVSVLRPHVDPASGGVGIACFLVGNGLQFVLHSHLASLRTGRMRTVSRYTFPDHWCFSLVSSPHYSAEILIYLGLLLVGAGHWLLSLNLVWVIVNLSCTARKNHAWYQENVDTSSLASFAIIPGVL